nr:MAG TPA: hypothetical protein [Caudoviricetes sp.]
MPSKTLLEALLSMFVYTATLPVLEQGLYMNHAYCTMSYCQYKAEYTLIHATSSAEGLGSL